jgi:hypothetical protein
MRKNQNKNNMKTTNLPNNTIIAKSSRPMRQLCGLAIAALGLGASLPSAHAQVTATGGTITSYTDGGITYDVHTFTGSGTFDVTGGGSVDYLIVGGGGGGGASTGGGGGAGGFVTGTTTVTNSTVYTITVGAGGAGGIQASAPYRGTNGGDSVFAGVTAFGGGGGGSNAPATPPPGLTDPSVGGSGGGGSGDSGRPGASGTSLQGNAGGSANIWGGPYTAGGGGGAGAAGANANGSNTGANGGAGLSSSITGTAKFYAGGGGGGMFNGSTGGLGGVGGGGNGGKPNDPTSGAANTGGGGGGQHQNRTGAAGSGGSGVVIIRFISTSPNPTSTNATLAAAENTEIALTASNFGYADPGSVALAAVEITSLPALGTLKLSGTPVVSGDLPLTVSAANIGTLSYLSPLGGFGSPYTTMGIKVQNANSLLSADALMTVNVTDVNQAPTSTGGSVILRKNTVKTFAAADFPFSDIDAVDTLQAIKVTSLPNPTNGTLTLSASAVTLNQVVDVVDITAGNLIYTPNTDYTGSDPFNFQVRDAALFSADATMALTVTADIIVQNGSFETIGASLGGPWARAAAVWNPSLTYAQTNDNARFATRTDAGIWYANLSDPGNTFYQNLGVSVNSGDTLAVTFYAGRENGRVGGVMAATFLVDGTPYTETFDTTGLTEGTWQSYTLTKTIANSGALTLQFSNVSGRPWLDNISNISVTTGGGPTPGSFADWALTNAPGQDPSQDKNNDGVQNGVAYFMGVTGLATNPGPDASNTVTWPMSATYQGTFVVQTSTDLGTWRPADPQPTPSGGNLTYTLPPNAPGGKSFVRLLVTPN